MIARLSADEVAALRLALHTEPGRRRPETLAALSERDDLIRTLAATYYPGLSRNQQAKAIRRDLLRYAGGEWRRTRSDEVCRHRDNRRVLYWRILRLRGGHVPAVRTIFGILGVRG
ncbi:hypothetical protein [Bradyrhizobium sp. UNPA324]|uniref:hypothetical protein n=1 Tax=Bradyrhizobium sp. UNPA324 TaxID=1141174 RepID=UPI001154F31B|nr:hypothetical protein [Bradyrhizobium sp. UNPA324]TQF30010.1 hypothetical protein UNPA324_10525 [Bradyrhizobium sp. UNPA324]